MIGFALLCMDEIISVDEVGYLFAFAHLLEFVVWLDVVLGSCKKLTRA